jgi:NTP pyrophosphatase (non-canonical NTP hydrolase)
MSCNNCSQFNKLSPAEHERLALLSEEASEVIKAVSKILRHGYNCYNPDDEEAGTNRQQLERELGDLQAAMRRIMRANDVDPVNISAREKEKIKSGAYLHHQGGKE